MTKDYNKKLAALFSYNPYFYIAIGDEDFLYQANKAYRETSMRLDIPTPMSESDCGHVWKNWRHYWLTSPQSFK